MSLSGPHRRFAEEIVKGATGVDAYLAAYPRAARNTARQAAARLRARPDVQQEIQAMREAADMKAGGAVLAAIEKRKFLARLVRLNVSTIDLSTDGDLLAGLDRVDGSEGSAGIVKLRVLDKLKAIDLDNDLSHEGSEAEANDALGALLERVMK